ncbi:MAG: hypothetical protein ABIP64_06280 [Burkholderiales bacterium]
MAPLILRRRELDIATYTGSLLTGMAIVPFERLRIERTDLDGSQGVNRDQVDFGVWGAMKR